MTRLLIAAAPLAVLAACSGGSDELQPGEWEMTTAMTDVEIEGMPEEMMAQMREQMASQTDTSSRCITPEEAADPGATLFTPAEAGEDCDFSESTVEGGVINISGTCESPEGVGSAEMTVEGNYTATTMEAEIGVNVSGGPMGEMRMSGTMTAERTGDCEA